MRVLSTRMLIVYEIKACLPLTYGNNIACSFFDSCSGL